MAKANKTAPVAAFVIGDRVIAKTAATLQQPATGTVTDISKTGWFIVQLDDTNAADVLASCKGGKLSARVSSLKAIAEPKASLGSTLGMLQAAADPAPKEPKSKPAKTTKAAPEAPTACPECGSNIEASTEDGNTTYVCTDEECGWEETIEADDHASRMSEALRKARQHYEKTHRPEGTASADCGDRIAKELRDYEPQDVANLADKVLQQPIGFHFGRYQNLNPGQIRMNSGNRIRAYWKKINEDGNEAEITRVGLLLNLIETE